MSQGGGEFCFRPQSSLFPHGFVVMVKSHSSLSTGYSVLPQFDEFSLCRPLSTVDRAPIFTPRPACDLSANSWCPGSHPPLSYGPFQLEPIDFGFVRCPALATSSSFPFPPTVTIFFFPSHPFASSVQASSREPPSSVFPGLTPVCWQRLPTSSPESSAIRGRLYTTPHYFQFAYSSAFTVPSPSEVSSSAPGSFAACLPCIFYLPPLSGGRVFFFFGSPGLRSALPGRAASWVVHFFCSS